MQSIGEISTPPPPSIPPAADLTRGQKRTLFFEALERGDLILEASQLAGVSVATGSRWANEGEKKASKGIPSKEGLIVSLFQAYTQAKPSSKANLAKRICDMLGYDMRAQDSDNTRSASAPLRDLVIAWATERAAKPRQQRVAAQPTGLGSPQMSAIGGAQTHSETATNFPNSAEEVAK